MKFLLRQIERSHKEYRHLCPRHIAIGTVDSCSTAAGDAFGRMLFDPGRSWMIRGYIRKAGAITNRRRNITGTVNTSQQ